MRNKACTEQREPRDEEIQDLLQEFKASHHETFELTQNIFSMLVDPELYYQDRVGADQVAYVNLIYSEWFLFDFKLEGGLSLIEEAAIDDPTIADYASSQFYSRFWVTKQDRRRGVITLRDMHTQDEFEVWDRKAACRRAWRKGTLGTRIARVGDVWVTAGKTSLHDNAPSKPLPARLGARDGFKRDPWLFLREAEAVIGHRGVFRETLSALEAI